MQTVILCGGAGTRAHIKDGRLLVFVQDRSAKARDLEPEKTSIREALGRALFRSGQYEQAAVEFEAVVERAPTNDYALFCLGRALMELGRPAEARKPLTLASQLRPERRDYRIYRERAAKAA
jgi:Flp pilus assembly protein TadD